MTKPCCPKCWKNLPHPKDCKSCKGEGVYPAECTNSNCECHKHTDVEFLSKPTEKEGCEAEFEGRFGHFWSKDSDGNKWIVVDKDGKYPLASCPPKKYNLAMTFARRPEIGRNAIDRAGKVLIDPASTDEQKLEARKILNSWRAAHGYPINTFQATLRSKTRGGDFGKDVVIAQRLKRAPTIIEKLQQGREHDIRLFNMQDIAGVRAILPTIEDVRKLEGEYKAMGRFQHQLYKAKDYITEPKDRDGYRSVHLIYKYKNNVHPHWDGLFIEVQIRTALQHSWATAVESVHAFEGKAIKTRLGQEGDQKWTEFFRLVSTAFAYMENEPVMESHRAIPKEQILEEIKRAEKDLKVRDKLKSYHAAMQFIQETSTGSHFHLLTIDTQQKIVNVKSFSESKSDEANKAYEMAEIAAIGREHIEAVLVSSNAVEEAYPSFFANTKDFLKNLEKVLSGEWAKSEV